MIVNIILGVVVGMPIGRLICHYRIHTIGIVLLSLFAALGCLVIYVIPVDTFLSCYFPLWTWLAALLVIKDGNRCSWSWCKYGLTILILALIGYFCDLKHSISSPAWDAAKATYVPWLLGYTIGGGVVVLWSRDLKRILWFCALVLGNISLGFIYGFRVVPSIACFVVSMSCYFCVLRLNFIKRLWVEVAFVISVWIGLIFLC